MAPKRETKTQEKHADIYKEYLRLLAEYGTEAPYIDKRRIYARIAEKCRCSSEHANRVVNNMLRCQGA